MTDMEVKMVEECVQQEPTPLGSVQLIPEDCEFNDEEDEDMPPVGLRK